MAACDRPVSVLRRLSVFHWTHGASEPWGRASEGPMSIGGGRPQAYDTVVHSVIGCRQIHRRLLSPVLMEPVFYVLCEIQKLACCWFARYPACWGMLKDDVWFSDWGKPVQNQAFKQLVRVAYAGFYRVLEEQWFWFSSRSLRCFLSACSCLSAQGPTSVSEVQTVEPSGIQQ